MLFETYKAQDRLWLINLASAMSGERFAFRGDFVVTHGTFNEAAKKRNPPTAMIHQAVMLEEAGALAMVAGNFSCVTMLPAFIETFGPDLAPECRPIFFVENIEKDVVVEAGGRSYELISFHSGMIWNQLLDLCALEKSDLKKLSAEEKVVAVYDELKSVVSKAPVADLESVLAARTERKREAWGAV
ncbi:MAG: hypothetical protein AAGM38_09745 [Pseudomonadota bacterium]